MNHAYNSSKHWREEESPSKNVYLYVYFSGIVSEKPNMKWENTLWNFHIASHRALLVFSSRCRARYMYIYYMNTSYVFITVNGNVSGWSTQMRWQVCYIYMYSVYTYVYMLALHVKFELKKWNGKMLAQPRDMRYWNTEKLWWQEAIYYYLVFRWFVESRILISGRKPLFLLIINFFSFFKSIERNEP